MILSGFKEISGQIKCLTGLKIGGTKETIGLGETDNPIIRHPINRQPYIPGSSLKGKMRSLLEMKYSNRSQTSGKPCDCGSCNVCILFGNGDPRGGTEPTRLIYRDAFLTEDSRKALEDSLPGLFAEVKTEIQMDRKAGKAARGALRQQERIPEGTVFDFTISMRIFKEDKAKMTEYLSFLADAFDMLEKDYLGGCGTRGYGKVKITHENQSMADYLRSDEFIQSLMSNAGLSN